MSNIVDLANLSETDVANLRRVLGVPEKKQPRVEPATISRWAPGKDGTGEWILAIADDDFRPQPIPYPIPRIVDVPDIYADGMDQFSAINGNTKRSVYESRGYLTPPALGSVVCPVNEYVRLMDRYNQERTREKKEGLPITPAAIPGPWGNASKTSADVKPAKGGTSGRA